MPAPKGGNRGSFKKGNKSGGRKKLSTDVREARSLSYEEMCKTVMRIREMSFSKAKKLKEADLTLGERVIIDAYLKLDHRGVKAYEDRLWGKAKESIDIDLSSTSVNKTESNMVFKFSKKEMKEYVQILIENGIISTESDS